MLLLLYLIVAAVSPTVLHIAAQADRLVSVTWHYSGKDCKGSALMISYAVSNNWICRQESRATRANGACNNDGSQSTKTTCKPLQSSWDSTPEPGYFCRIAYQGTDCTGDLSSIECYTMDELGKCWPHPGRHKLTPIPDYAGAAATAMSLAFESRSGVCDYTPRDFTNGQCFVIDNFRSGTFAMKTVW